VQFYKATSNRARRKHELGAIAAWIAAHDQTEKDFIILGDMNIEHQAELMDATPLGFLSLNDECRPTNTNANKPEPYDHIMFRPAFTGEIDQQFDMAVIDLVKVAKDYWTFPVPYPGDPYDGNQFQKYYSDHNPVVFRMVVPDQDDD
jgi:endonuclease/exonuclease/phosphatase family metal-dependent hydrolase